MTLKDIRNNLQKTSNNLENFKKSYRNTTEDCTVFLGVNLSPDLKDKMDGYLNFWVLDQLNRLLSDLK